MLKFRFAKLASLLFLSHGCAGPPAGHSRDSFALCLQNSRPVISIDFVTGNTMATDIFSSIERCSLVSSTCISRPILLDRPPQAINVLPQEWRVGSYQFRLSASGSHPGEIVLVARDHARSYLYRYHPDRGLISVEISDLAIRDERELLTRCFGQLRFEDLARMVSVAPIDGR